MPEKIRGPHGQDLEVEGVDPLAAKTFSAFLGALHFHRQAVTGSLAARGSRIGHARCLRVVAAHEGISQRDLAKLLHLSAPTVTTMLHAMEEAGAITRTADARDRRITRISLTEHGRELEREMRAGLAEFINRTIGVMSKDDQREFTRLLGIFTENLEAIAGDSTEVIG